jgi:hypothetical protein
MMDDYLWDRSGEPDAYVRHLEKLLERYRFDRPIELPAVWPKPATEPRRTRPRPRLVSRWISFGLAAAAAAVVLFVGYLASIPTFGQPGRDWRVVAGAGRPIVSGAPIAGSGTLAAGGVVRTDANARAVIRAGRVGRIEVLPGSLVRLISTGAGRHRLAVDRGESPRSSGRRRLPSGSQRRRATRLTSAARSRWRSARTASQRFG